MNNIFSKKLRQLFRRSIIILFVNLLVGFNAFAQSKDYINTYKPLAFKLSKEFGIPPSIILGVAIIESGAGKSKNCQLLNNHFGVKGKNHAWKEHHYHTSFKYFENAEASYLAFCEMISRKKFYPNLKNNPSHLAWLNAMSKAHYAENPTKWKKLILNAIKRYKLDTLKQPSEVNELQQKDSVLSTSHYHHTFPLVLAREIIRY